MKKPTEWTGYVSKAGKNGLYKIIGRFKTPEGVQRVRLEGFAKEGATPIQFWVDESKLCAPPQPKRKEGEETRECWECGCLFTYREAKANGGEWQDSYCGC
jgi:hypothetical protein